MSMTPSTTLPIVEALPRLRAALAAHRSAVLQAPPGAGKSTGVPLALLDEPWVAGKKILMLEPRRLAARAVATRMASMLGEPVGRTVGYRTRLDDKVSDATRIEVVTEGILTRRLQRDAALEDTAIVIFDEFHERSLQADLGLALCLDVQEQLRTDLKLLIMSATLDGQAVARLLGDAPIVTSDGRAFDVETIYRGRPRSVSGMDAEAIRAVAATVLQAHETESGDMLVFLPGQGEIHRVQRLLTESALPRAAAVLPLHGSLAPADQDLAIRRSEPGRRKIVLTTNIAETSLTIEGVRIVVDAGWVRRSRFDPNTGMSSLDTLRISRASADQRRGRAGRLEPGVCFRLWTESDHAAMAAQSPAEIIEADLAPLALELASWGAQDAATLRWLDPPPDATLSQARELLQSLAALDATGKVTTAGRAMAGIGAHPRLAHMLLRSGAIGQAETAANLAAVLEEKDLFRYRAGQPRDIDIRLRLDALRDHALPHDVEVDRGAKQRIKQSAAIFLRQLGAQAGKRNSAEAEVGVLLAWGFPDRIAQPRGAGGRYLLTNGRGAVLSDAQSIGNADYLVVAELDDSDRDARIRLAAPLSREQLELHFADAIGLRSRIEWDDREQAVVARREKFLNSLTLSVRKLDTPDADAVASAMLDGVRTMGLDALPWTKESRSLQARIEFLRGVDVQAPEPWPVVSDTSLAETLDHWLTPWLNGISRRDHLIRLDMHGVLQSLLSWNQQTRLGELAPTHLTVPSGSHIPIDYSNSPPTLSVRLQEMFGQMETPRVGGGRVPLLIELLSPARRPVQTTQDLKSFWARGYHDVKKDLKGRYPKHYWPDDPLLAEATARAKPRST
jgi:ATP-dependent helicase HrpB